MKATLSAPPQARTRTPRPSAATAPIQTGQATEEAPPRVSQKDQMVFLWPSPCVSGMVYSTERRSVLPRTWDENCFRGDAVARRKNADEYRVAFLGGSTVQDFQSDEEMMTAQFKRAFTNVPSGKRVLVVNAGRSGFGSRDILDDYRARVSGFSIDLVVYYEAWNEQPKDLKPRTRADAVISRYRNRVHATLYHRSMLYTYLIEKHAFLTTSRGRFWKIDVDALRRNLTDLAREIRSRGGSFVFVTQAVKFPRMWKGVDTFDYRAVDALLDRLKADLAYEYDVVEISALNQRLTVADTLRLCSESRIPVVNILDPIEALGEGGRAELFMDLGHLTVKGDKVVGELVANRLNHTD